MNILLINVDSRWNMAIRKMYTYFTQQGHEVEKRESTGSIGPARREASATTYKAVKA